MGNPISLEKALSICREKPLNLPIEFIPLANTLNRTLAEDLISLVDDPAFDNSAMDGWAVRSNDKTRTEIGITGAGDEPNPLNPGEAIRIMTGAPMPPGADAIVLVEDGLDGPAHTNFIRKRGENIERGATILFSGQHLTPASISLAAILRNIRLIIFPDRVLGSPGAHWIASGVAIGPISFLTHCTKVA